MRRRLTEVVVLLGMAGMGLAATAAPVSAVSTTCLVVDTNANTTYTGLQDAVDAAAAGDTLFVKGTCTGATEIGKNLTIDGHSASGTKTATLNGGRRGTVLTIDSGVSVTLNALIITNGGAEIGGGILNGGTVTLNGSTVTGNTTGEDGGGGIYNDGTVTLNGSTVTGNTGGIFGGGGISNNSGTVTLNGSTVTGNTAAGLAGRFGGGGGILNFAGTVTLNGSTISGNTTGGDGGGINNTSTGTVTMSGTSTVHDNTAIQGEGGGICNSSPGTLVGAVAGVNVYNNTPDNIFSGLC